MKNVFTLKDIDLPELQPVRVRELHALSADLTGQTFGRLIALWPLGTAPKGRGIRWLCICTNCQKLKVTLSNRLLSGNCTSCGCLQRERSSAFVTAMNAKKYKARFPGMLQGKPAGSFTKG
jgi:hypothetical protein